MSEEQDLNKNKYHGKNQSVLFTICFKFPELSLLSF